MTYSSLDRIDHTVTQGGYSKYLVVREEFVLRVPDGLDLSRAAPLLCAGYHDVFATQDMGCRPGQPCRGDWHGWSRPYGDQAGCRAGS